MYKQGTYRIKSNHRLTSTVWEMVLEGDTHYIRRAGQFVEVALPERYLRRPISVCDFDDQSLTLVYKVVGGGTEQMSSLRRGAKLDLLTGLGNGFDTAPSGPSPLIVGGGVGVPPLYNLAKRLIAEGKEVTAVLGFNSEEEIFYAERFDELGAKVFIATADGSCGVRGFVTDAIGKLHSKQSYYYACGPMPMLTALCRSVDLDGQLSLEERMGCGFGVCMGCSIQTADGPKRVCTEGPVFDKKQLLW